MGLKGRRAVFTITPEQDKKLEAFRSKNNIQRNSLILDFLLDYYFINEGMK